MKFECDSCHAQYMIADEKVGKRGVKVKCKKCQHVIIVRPDKEAAAPKAADKPVEKVAAEKPAPKAEKREKKPRVEVPQETLAQAPPPGLDLNQAAVDAAADGDTFAQGGPTDPSQAALAPPPPPPPLDDEQPETTGPNLAPAPVSLFGDATQLTKNPMRDQASAPDAHDDRTELSAKAQLTEPPAPPEEQPRRSHRDAKTVVQPQALPDSESAEPPAPPPMAPPAQSAKVGGAAGELEDELAGAFNSMFDEGPKAGGSDEDPGYRGPTKVLDLNNLNELRKAAGGNGTGNGVADSLGSGPDPRQLFEAGLVKVDARAAPGGADDGPAEQVWHAAIDDQDVGPLSLAEVGRHIEAGRVDRESLVWKVGMDDWLPAGEVPAVRALFDKVPMPRIARVDDEPRASKRSNSFDTGPPIDDGLPPGASPNGGPSPFDDNSNDDSWRPHGLTDVYQAANLAEAAGMGALGSIGGSPSVAPSMKPGGSALSALAGASASSSASSSSSEPEWRPGAASALSALVQDEIKRIDKGPPSASDDDLSPADDASINAPMFGQMSGGRDLDAGPEVGDLSRPQASPGLPTFDARNGNGNNNSSFPPGGFMSSPPAQQSQRLSPVMIAGIAGGGLVVVLLVVVLAVIALRGPSESGPKIVMVEGKAFVMSADGKLVPVGGDEKKDDDKKADAKKDDDKKVDTKKDDAASGVATVPGKTGGGDNTASAGGIDGTKVATKETPKNNDDDDAPDRPAKTTSHAEHHDVKTVAHAEHHDAPPPPPPPPPKDERASAPKGCDPVLDFDCKPGGGKSADAKAGDAKAKSADAPAAEVKDKLAPTDVLVVVKSHLGAVQGCGKKNKATGVIKMSWKIQPKGNVTDVSVSDAKFAGTPVGSCVTNEIKGWKFPAAKTASPPISFPLNLGS